MALAILRFAGTEGGSLRFEAELGSNRYYSFAVGGAETDSSGGARVMRERRYTSPLFGPLAEPTRGRVSFEVPRSHFDRQHRHIQLASFRTPSLQGPAVSEVLNLPVTGGAADEGFQPIAFEMRAAMHVQPRPSQPVPFRYREAPPLSQSLFLDGLLSRLPSLLPGLGNLLGSLLGGGNTAGARPPSTAGAQNPNTAALLAELLQRLLNAPGAPRSAQQSLDYSQAQVAPALLALLPLLSQVLTPQTVQSLIGSLAPDKLIGAVTHGIGDLARLGLQGEQQLRDHLRALNPGVDDPSLDRLLEGMSAFEPRRAGEPDYRRVRAVRLGFSDSQPVLLHGRPRVLYRNDREARFPLTVETPRPIRDAVLHLMVRRPSDGELLASRRLRVAEATTGPLSVVPTLPPEELGRLRRDEEYLVCVALVWKDGQGRSIGTSLSHLVTLVGEYTFDRVEDAAGLIPLNDVQRHRDFWHKVWQGTFTEETRHVDFECKYYYTLEPERAESARLETRSRLERSGVHREEGRLKSGLVASLSGLNRLLPQVSPHPALGGPELEALASPDFVRRFGQAARFRATFHGRPGQSAALWVYPVVKVHRVVLQRAERVDALGQVVQVAERSVFFPLPVLVHFIGARSPR